MIDKESNIVQSKYFHINNGGVSFSIIDSDHGPSVHIILSTCGHESELSTYFSTIDLAEIGNMFIVASEHKFANETYCCAAEFHCDDDYAVECVAKEKSASE